MAERKPYRRRDEAVITAVRVDLDTDGFAYRKWGGTQRAKPGDWLVDNGGEVYTVDADVFAATYRPVAPGRYRKEGVVWAARAERAGTIATKEGSTSYRAGDYLVSNDEAGRDGWAVEAVRFAELYAPADEDGTAADGETVESGVLWRRLDAPGHDAARLVRGGGGWRIEGTAVFAEDGRPCGLRYRVDCGGDWVSRRATIDGWLGARRVEVEIAAAEDRRWTLDGRHVPAADGCLDLDLAFTPATNLLPIRRLALAIGAEAAAPAAWLTLPELTLARLEQTYRRKGEATYDYAAHGGAFRRTLTMTPAGFVALYPGLWKRIAGHS